MVDTKRKGKLLYCENCGKKTRHVAVTDRSEKLVWWVCACGDSRLQNNWS